MSGYDEPIQQGQSRDAQPSRLVAEDDCGDGVGVVAAGWGRVFQLARTKTSETSGFRERIVRAARHRSIRADTALCCRNKIKHDASGFPGEFCSRRG